MKSWDIFDAIGYNFIFFPNSAKVLTKYDVIQNSLHSSYALGE
jgi:hypothetical protein